MGRTLASGSRDRTIRLWDTETGQHKQTLDEHSRGVTCLSFSPDGTHLSQWQLGPYDSVVGRENRATPADT